jgi:integrase
MEVLDAAWTVVLELITQHPDSPKRWQTFLRSVAMLHFHTASGARPTELTLLKQGDLHPERLHIGHGAQKDSYPKERSRQDMYGTLLGRGRDVAFHTSTQSLFPDRLLKRLFIYRDELLPQMGLVKSGPARAMFPVRHRNGEACVSYPAYADGFKRLLGVVVEKHPRVQEILREYLVRPANGQWVLHFTPHMVRAVVATHLARTIAGPGMLMEVQDRLGWLNPSTLTTYFRPQRKDVAAARSRIVTRIEANHESRE